MRKTLMTVLLFALATAVFAAPQWDAPTFDALSIVEVALDVTLDAYTPVAFTESYTAPSLADSLTFDTRPVLRSAEVNLTPPDQFYATLMADLDTYQRKPSFF